MKVPLLDLTPQNHPLEDEFVAAFREVLHSNRFILGPKVEELEEKLATLCETKHAIGVSSGTDALLLAFMALGLGPGDEVLCPTFTFFATAGCISRTGATPVFVDACPVCFNIDVNDARRKITENTKAIVPVHLFGQAAEMDSIMALAKEHNLHVVEDAAQAIGSKYKGKAVGGFGDFGTYSFFPSKNLGGFGDGGMLVCNDDELYEMAKILRVHGSKPKYEHKYIGANFRLDPLQAAMLLVKLPHYGSYTEGRKQNAALYLEQLLQRDDVVQADPSNCGCSEAAKVPSDGPRLTLPVAYQHNDHIWNQFTMRVHGSGQRDALKAHLQSHDIGCEVYYPISMHQQPCFASLPASACPVAEILSNEVLSLPVFPELTSEQQQFVVDQIQSFLHN